MAPRSSDQDTLDFAGLTDAIIPSSIYLNSWNQPDLLTSPSIQSYPFGFNMFAPAFDGMLPLSSGTENQIPVSDPMMPNHYAVTADSLQPFDPSAHNQNRGVGNSSQPRPSH